MRAGARVRSTLHINGSRDVSARCFAPCWLARRRDRRTSFWEAYYGGIDLRGLTVLDPFVGGGTSVVEASRLGAKTMAVDVDPVACFVTNLELKAAGLPDLENALVHLQDTIGSVCADITRS